METNPTRPSNPEQVTSTSVVKSQSSDSVENRPNDGRPSSVSKDVETQQVSASPPQPPGSGYHASYLVPLVAALIMLVWPWIVFGVVWSRDGIATSPHLSVLVRENQQTVTFLATHFGTLFGAIAALLFSTAIVRFCQKWIAYKQEVDLFHISIFTTLKHQRFPWGVKDLSTLASKWHFVIIVLACIFAFNFVPSGISALLAPVPFNKTASLTGTELDFTSNAPDCVTWLQIPRIQPTCNWFSYNNLEYTSCLGENQLVDALEAGRGNIFALLSNNTQSQVFSQLGASGGLQFLGPVRGVLPLGPNGVPAFNTLSPSPLSNPHTLLGISSYQYTLNLQGLASQIKCEYTTSSPIFFNKSADGIYQTLATCPPGQDVFSGVPLYISIVSLHTLGFWTCGQGERNPDGSFDSYLLYLRGYLDYDSNIGNITCTLSQVQHAIFPVTFASKNGVFSSLQPIQPSTNSPSDLIRQSILAMGSLVSEGQGYVANSLAESVITFGVKSFGLSPFSQDPKYLQLFEAMLQGVIEYEATYVRLVYTANNTGNFAAPHSCIRTVSGSTIYEVTGWHYDRKTIAFLLPTTFINLASVILLLVAMYMGEKVLYSTDPTDPKSIMVARPKLDRQGTKVKIDLAGDGVYNFWKDFWAVIKSFFMGSVQDAGLGIAEAGAQAALNEIGEQVSYMKDDWKAEKAQPSKQGELPPV